MCSVLWTDYKIVVILVLLLSLQYPHPDPPAPHLCPEHSVARPLQRPPHPGHGLLCHAGRHQGECEPATPGPCQFPVQT